MTRLKNTRAFTLIELIVVIVIIGILAAVAAVSYNSFIGNANESALRAASSQFAKVLQGESAYQQGPITISGLGTTGKSTVTTSDFELTKSDNTKKAISQSAADDLTTALGSNKAKQGASVNEVIISSADTNFSCTVTLGGPSAGTSNTVDCG